MSLDKTVRRNLDGEYIIIYANQFKEGIKYAEQIRVPQIQLRGKLGGGTNDYEVNFEELVKIVDNLKIISFGDMIENIENFNHIYNLQNLEKFYFQTKQNFKIDISKFKNIKHLGAEYWKGLINIEQTLTLESLVLFKFMDTNLLKLSKLEKLKILHLYSSKIQTLEGVEKLPLNELYLVRNNLLENIDLISSLSLLDNLLIEKCKKVANYNFSEEFKKRTKIRILK